MPGGRVKGDGRGRLGGRAKGTPNKVTVERRALIASFVEKNWDDFEKNFKEIKDPVRKCDIYMSMMQYYAPKLAAIDYKDKTPMKSFKDELDEDSGLKTRENKE